MCRLSRLLPLLAALPGSAFAQEHWEVTRLTIHRHIVMKVPRMAPVEPPTTPTRWKERKGPDCVATVRVGGAIVRDKGVDLVLTGGERVRVKLGSHCPALGFYSGLYLKPAADGMMCVHRDTIRTRSGDACGIEAIRRLEARP